MGAAIQAGVLEGQVSEIILLDVTPLSLGVETMGGVNSVLIPRNTTIPTKRSQVYSTAFDGQTEVEIKVLQGERPMAEDNKSLGNFTLGGLPPAPKGVPQIQVTFDIDANGIVLVSALDTRTNKSKDIRITSSGGLSKADIERMIKEAELHQAEDKKKQEMSQAKNEADSLVYNTNKQLEEHKDKLTEDNVKLVKDDIEAVQNAISSEDPEEIRTKCEALRQTTIKAFEGFYKNNAGSTGGAAAGGAAGDADAEPSNSDATDVPYKRVDDDKKN